MCRVLESRFGWAKQWLMALVLLLGCYLPVFATGVEAFLISLAVSAAITAAQIGLQILLAPKPKPVEKNKLQGDIQLQTVGEGIFINELYGGEVGGDGQGGNRTGGTIFYASQIVNIPIRRPGQSTGGGKGGPKPPPTNENHYYQDYAILVGSQGPLKIKAIYADQDLIYKAFAEPDEVFGITYEAESNTSNSGGITIVADPDMSNSQKVDLDLDEWVEWNNIPDSGDSLPRELYVSYKNSQDNTVEITVNGVTHLVALANSSQVRRNFMLTVTLPNTLSTVRIKNKTNAVLSLDRIVVGVPPINPDTTLGGCHLSGTQWLGYQNPEPFYSYMSLRDPLLEDPRGCDQWNYQPQPSTFGDTTAYVMNSGIIRIYPGTWDQMPDPLLQTHFEAKYGVGATPAFRGRTYVVIEHFELTKYGRPPNFTFVTEHETINSVGELFTARALRAGLQPDELDFSALNAVPLRGLPITAKQPPAREIEHLSLVYDIAVYQSFDGKIVGVIPSETSVATIPTDELDAQDGGGEVENDNDEVFAPIRRVIRDPRDLPWMYDAGYFNPGKLFEPANQHSIRDLSVSDKKESIELGMTLTDAEAKKFVDRHLHKLYVEKDALEVTVFPKHSWVEPTSMLTLIDTDGSEHKMRVQTNDGWLPGSHTLKGVSREAFEYPPRLYTLPGDGVVIPTFLPPAPIVGTFIDLAVMREEAMPGFYVVAALTDQHYVWRGASLFRALAGDWEPLMGLPHQGRLGRTVSALADPPAGWDPGEFDDTSQIVVDFFYGTPESASDTELTAGMGYTCVGDEMLQVGIWTRNNSFPNRWVGTHLLRALRGTSAVGHAANERTAIFDSAWRYIEQDPDLGGVTRTYAFVGTQGDINAASTVNFNWTGRTRFNEPIYNVIDNDVPELSTSGPTLATVGANLQIFIERPVAFGYSARIAEIRVRRSDTLAVLTQQDIGDTVDWTMPAPAVDSLVDYRWRNGYRLNASDGWSAWSVTSSFVAATPPPPPPVVVGGGDPIDPGTIIPIGGLGGCFAAHMQVLMADWTVKTIEATNEQDVVMSWTPDLRLVPGLVTAALHDIHGQEVRRLQLDHDIHVVSTTHPYALFPRIQVKVEDMREPDRWDLFGWMSPSEGGMGWGHEPVQSIEPIDWDAPLHNITVDRYHTFFVRGQEGAPWIAVFNKIIN